MRWLDDGSWYGSTRDRWSSPDGSIHRAIAGCLRTAVSGVETEWEEFWTPKSLEAPLE